ncbi:MAG: hypothetical protein PHX80_03670 [Candidatus Nanoarchaeia archaeon]|nr:hypothetical protein [Candidatus Nanoarchaeia archaeon]
MGYFQDEIKDAFGKKWAKVIITFIVVIAVYIAVALFWSIWPFSSAARVVQKVTSAEAIISNYEYFYDMKNQIDATANKVKIAEKAMDSAKGTEKESDRQTEYYGIQMVLQGMVAEYNSKSKQITRNLWKAKDLPYQISMEVDK